MKKIRLTLSLTSLLVLAFAALNAQGASANSSQLIDLGTLPGGNFSYAYGINNLGHVVGYSNLGGGNVADAFLWKDNSMIDLGSLNNNGSYAAAINNKDQVVGNSGDAFLWQNGQMTDIGNFQANAINDKGEVVGYELVGNYAHAVLWSKGVLTDLGTLGGIRSEAFGINNKDQIVGFADITNGLEHAFFWQNGAMNDIGTLGGNESVAQAINNSGTITGWSDLNCGQQNAFVYSNGLMSNLGDPSLHSIGTAINDSGTVAGYSDTTASTSNFAVTWTKGSTAFLGLLTGGDRTEAYAINNQGKVAGYGNGPDGSRAFLYIP